MKKFILKLISAVIIVYLLLCGIQYTIDFYLQKDNSCSNNTWSQIYDGKINAQIVVLGTSRAEVHYDTQIISQLTGLKTYNLGLSGTHYDILQMRWRSFLDHNIKPKILILDLDSSSLQRSEEIYNKFQYLPYLNRGEYIAVAKDLDSDYYFEKYIPIYKYRGYEVNIYQQIRSLKTSFFCPKNKDGYIENDINWIEKDYLNFKKMVEDDKLKDNFNYDEYKKGFKVLNEIMSDCKRHNIKVFFVWSPSYFESDLYMPNNKKCIDKILSKISKQNNIAYYNFLKDSICLKKENFYNSSHMNKKGVAIFSKKISEIINDKK
ncbi:hypothetical protein [Flavobacterium sp. FlaQc-47]|uniref:hypothetical protein n=1 Tax=Flavobacterium sp. FlaQc-47 TaxID=3374180 RepID=UPI0037564422